MLANETKHEKRIHRPLMKEALLSISPNRRLREGWLSMLVVLPSPEPARRKDGRSGESMSARKAVQVRDMIVVARIVRAIKKCYRNRKYEKADDG